MIAKIFLLICMGFALTMMLIFVFWNWFITFPKLKRFLYSFINRVRIRKYKKRKIKESKQDFDTDFHIKFKLVLNDNSGNHMFDDTEFEITVPAKAAFFARRKLENHIRENIAIQITDIKGIEDDN